ncbi:MAG: hypothetical protein R2814_16245 [Flavobacteriaceae bacterium]
MRIYLVILILIILGSCSETEEGERLRRFKIESIYTDSLSFRAIEIMDGGNMAFAANKVLFGFGKTLGPIM